MRYGEGSLQRSESVVLEAVLDRNQYDSVKEHVDMILKSPLNLNDGDNITVTYNFSIEYLGNIVEKINAYLKIFENPEIVKSISVVELEHGQCLIKELFDKISEIQKLAV